METEKKRKRLQEIYVREELCEGVFDTWVSEQGAEGILDTLGELLWWLDAIASCRWGCREGDHEEEHLLGRVSESGSAALLLVRRGYIGPALGAFRQLAETANLVHLFTCSSEAYKEWRTSDEGVKKNQFSAFNVRRKLEGLSCVPVMEKDAYQLLSSYGTHPGPGVEPRSHDSPEEPTTGTAYRPAVGFSLTVSVASSVVTALIFGSSIVTKANVKLDALNAAKVANEKLKKEATLVLKPPTIKVTEETHEDNP